MWTGQYGGGGGGGGGYWPGNSMQQNPIPQSTDPGEWAAKAAQWAQQRQVHETSTYYHQQQQVLINQQQQQQMMLQQQQQQQQLQPQQMQQGQVYTQAAATSQISNYAQDPTWSQLQGQQQQQQVYAQTSQPQVLYTQSSQSQVQQHVQVYGQSPVAVAQPAIAQSQDYSQGVLSWSQPPEQQADATTQLPPKPLFDTPLVHPTHTPVSHPAKGTPSNQSQYYVSAGEEQLVAHPPATGGRFPHPRGPRSFAPRGGNFAPRAGARSERFCSPRGRGGSPRPRFAPRGSPRGSPPISSPSDGSSSSSSSRTPQGSRGGHHGGPTAEHFNRGSPVASNSSKFSQSEGFGGKSLGQQARQGEVSKKLMGEKEREIEKELEMMKKEMQRQRQSEMGKTKEREELQKREEEKAAAIARARQLEEEQRRREEEAKREAEEIEKKRQLDLQLAQEIENKKKEMERILEQKEQMERELMEKQAALGRIGRGGEGWGAAEDYQSQRGGMESTDMDIPTIPSWNQDPGSIPGLGELKTDDKQPSQTSADVPHREGPQPQSGQPAPEKKEDDPQMVESLGKIVSQLQTLQGLTSSLKLLKKIPKDGLRNLTEKEKEEIRERELTEDTKRKVAALLANDSDSEGEKVSTVAEGRMDSESPTVSDQEYDDGGYNVQSQAYQAYRHSEEHRSSDPYNQTDNSGLRYSKYDYDERRGEGREGRAEYGGYPSRDEDDYRYPPRRLPPPPPPRPPDPEPTYPPSRGDYPPYSGGDRWSREESERRPPLSPPPLRGVPPRDYPYGRLPYSDPETPAMRNRHYPEDYRGHPPPPPSDPYYHRPSSYPLPVPHPPHPPPHHAPPPPEPPRRGGGILSQMESIDYSHGGGGVGGGGGGVGVGGDGVTNIKIVDYGHASAGYPPPARDAPPRPPHYPSFGGPGSEYAAVYGEAYGGFGAPAGGGGGGGGMEGYIGNLDPAAIFAAYQGGDAKRRTLPLWLREELEKLERKKAKQLEKEAMEGARGEGGGREGGGPSWAEELEREVVEEREEEEEERVLVNQGRWGLEAEEEEEGVLLQRKTRVYRQRSLSFSQSGDEGSPPPEKRRHYEPPPESEEDQHIHLVMKLREMLTEILLNVTNQEVEEVVKETIEEAKKPKLVIQMKGLAANVNTVGKDNKQLLGLGAYSSDSESEDGSSDGETGGRKTKSPVAKIPKPDEIAAAFGGGFLPVPRSVQEKQRESERTSSSTSSGSSKSKEKAKKEKKSKEKKLHDSGNDSGGGGGGGRHHDKRDRKKSSDKEHHESHEGSRKSSTHKDKKRAKDRDRDKEKDRDREKDRGKEQSSSHDTKHSPSPSSSKYSKPRHRSSSTSSSSSSKRRGIRSGHKSPSPPPPPPPPSLLRTERLRTRSTRSRSPPMNRMMDIISSAPHIGSSEGVVTGKGSIQTTKGFVSTFQQGCPPIQFEENVYKRRRSPSPPLPPPPPLPQPPRGSHDDDVSYRSSRRRISSNRH